MAFLSFRILLCRAMSICPRMNVCDERKFEVFATKTTDYISVVRNLIFKAQKKETSIFIVNLFIYYHLHQRTNHKATHIRVVIPLN